MILTSFYRILQGNFCEKFPRSTELLYRGHVGVFFPFGSNSLKSNKDDAGRSADPESMYENKSSMIPSAPTTAEDPSAGPAQACWSLV